MDSSRRRVKTGLWGHIAPYVNAGNPLDLALEKIQLRLADHVFAYAPGGRDFALAAGAPAAKVTTVMNATDTRQLEVAQRSLDPKEAQAFMESHGLRRRRTLAFIGGLDSSKRIDFLAAALDILWTTDPDVRVLVGGIGALSAALDPAVSRGQVIMMGYVDAKGQALLGYASAALVMPGRIGLVAVDALVLGLPILTTSWPYHAPEAEFLLEGESRFTSDDNVYAYASLIRKFLSKTVTQEEKDNHWTYPTIDAMVDNFSDGVMKMLHQG